MPASSAGDQAPVIFGNLRQGATFGDRPRLTVKQSEHFNFSEIISIAGLPKEYPNTSRKVMLEGLRTGGAA